MPFLVWHTSPTGSSSGAERPWPQLSPFSSATSQKCPPITTWLSITSTACTLPEVSRLQLRLPSPTVENAARKSSVPAVQRYSAPLAPTSDIPHEVMPALATQEASCTPSVLSLTSALAG